MKAYKFTKDSLLYAYTVIFSIELSDGSPFFRDEGSPVEVPIPKVFKGLMSTEEVVREVRLNGEFLGGIGCSNAYKYKETYLAITSWDKIWILSFRQKGAKKAFLEKWGYDRLVSKHIK